MLLAKLFNNLPLARAIRFWQFTVACVKTILRMQTCCNNCIKSKLRRKRTRHQFTR